MTRLTRREFWIDGVAILVAGAPHGMCSTLKNQINAELLAFLQSGTKASAR